MKIVHVTKYFSGTGGIESYTRSAAKAAVKAGHEVIVICSSGTKKNSERRDGKVRIIELAEKASPMNAPIMRPSISLLIGLRPDVIHLHIPNPWAEINSFIYKLLSPKTRLVATYHSDVISYNPLMKVFAALRLVYLVPAMNLLCDKIIATSENYVSGSLPLKLSKNKVKIISIGVDTRKFMPGKNINHTFTFLFVGRLIPYKGLENLVKACGIAKGSGKKFILQIVGSGKLYHSLKKLASDAGVRDRIKFLGSVSDTRLPSVYRKCDVFVLPSVYKSEAFGLAQLEAMASGKPVISTKIKGSGVSFVNQDGSTGIVIKPGDEIALANAMMRLMDDKNLKTKMGLNARKRVVLLFDQRKIEKELMKIYEL